MVFQRGGCVLSLTIALFKIRTMPGLLTPLYLILDSLCLQAFYFMIKIYLKSSSMVLNISSGREAFEFGSGDENRSYNKKNISSIDIYGQPSRSSKIFNLMKITFNDGKDIVVPGIIIDPFKFIHKFPNIKATFISGFLRGIMEIWNFTK